MKSARGFTLLELMIVVAIIAIVLALFTGAGGGSSFGYGVDADTATRALTNEGLTNVKITGYQVFACAKGDHYHTGFEATNAQGRRVSGVVCSGWFKAATIRW